MYTKPGLKLGDIVNVYNTTQKGKRLLEGRATVNSITRHLDGTLQYAGVVFLDTPGDTETYYRTDLERITSQKNTPKGDRPCRTTETLS
jgi:hypothetical protein